jgi:hypothetical protein
MASACSENSASKNSDSPQINEEEIASQPHAGETENVLQPEGNAEEAAPNSSISYISFEKIKDLEARFTVDDEARVRFDCGIPSSVRLHFKNPATKSVDGGEVCLYKKMFLAGLRLPFPPIVRELLQYLHVSPGQILPNGWRYFFATYIQWPTIFDGQLMSIREFFNIYRAQAYTDGTVGFKSRGSSLFIYLHPTLLSNKVWRNEYFLVSGAWECAPTETLTEEQRILRNWSAPSADGKFLLDPISVFNFSVL